MAEAAQHLTPPDALTVAFVEAHPLEAAQELARVPAGEAAVLLASLPGRVLAPVLARMAPRAAAEVLQALPAERVGLVLAAMGSTALATSLRHVPTAQRAALLEQLPAARAMACRALLRYPDDAVGAWAQVEVPMLNSAATVADALQLLQQQSPVADGVFVIGPAQQLHGWVGAGPLLQARPTQPLSAVLQPLASLPAMMPVAAAIAQPLWDDAVVVAVVERGQRLVGSVSRAALRQAAGQHHQAGHDGARPLGTAGLLASGYWQAVCALSQVLVSALVAKPGARR